MQILVGENNGILRTRSKKITVFDKNLKKLIQEMKKFMVKSDGVGLAAPQIGINEDLVIVTLDQKKVIAMINPEILEFSKETEIYEEGCLSLPGVWGNVERPRQIKVKFIDEKGNLQVLILKSLNARVVQHEFDHLEGILFTDKMIRKNIFEQENNKSFSLDENL